MKRTLVFILLFAIMGSAVFATESGIAGYAVALPSDQIVVYDVLDMSTDNFQGDVLVVSGLDAYSWGSELSYLSANGFADKNKKVTGNLGIRFIPVQEDGSYCKKFEECTWEDTDVTITTDDGEYTVYIPEGDSYSSYIYFYVTEDGSTYWAKSGHTEGPNSHIDLTFEEAFEDHLARSAPKAEPAIDPVKPAEPTRKITVEAVERVEDAVNNTPLLIGAILAVLVVLFLIYSRKAKKPKVNVRVSKRRNVSKKKSTR
jgi:hypothetical protein